MSRRRAAGRRRPSARAVPPAGATRPTLWPALGARRQIGAALALAALVAAAYANSLSAELTLDNKARILEDPRIREATPENIGLILQHSYWWPRGEAGLYRPMTTLSYLFNYAVLGNGEQPAGYHWVNFLLHLANVLLVFALARRLIREDLASFFIASIRPRYPSTIASGKAACI